MACAEAGGVSFVRQTFQPDPAGARAARKFARAALADYEEQADLAELIVSELAANVVRHAETSFEVGVEVGDSVIRLSVSDGAAVDLRVTAAEGDATSGRGLAIVESLAYRWGVERTTDGKTVWVELVRPRR